MKEKPYLTIVVASRNDNHGGDILKRMKLFVSGLIAQTNRHKLPVELLIVEWNPPEDRPRLQSILPTPEREDFLSARYVIVPPAIHRRYKRATEIPLFQMIAKNVGIRRAKADFILCTNVDLLFSDPLFRILASRRLKHDTFYRANRCDVPDGIDPEWNFEKQLAWCSEHIIRRYGMDSRFKNINLEQMGLGHKAVYKKWIFNQVALGMQILWTREKRRYYQIDSFACGDFTLMSRATWFDIWGYYELDLYSIHIDTLALISATALGRRQHVFSREACTYHIDHSDGWSAMTPLEKIRMLEKRPSLDYGLVYETGMLSLTNKESLAINSSTWGFSDQVFEECTFPSPEA